MKKRLVLIFIFGIFFCLNGEVFAGNAPDVGTMQCRGVQKAVQAQMEKYNSRGFLNHIKAEWKTLKIIRSAFEEKLVSSKCAWCIERQFLWGVQVEKQKACGSDASPTKSCQVTDPSSSQINESVGMTIAQFSDPFGRVEQFEGLRNLTEQVLGCNLGSNFSDNETQTSKLSGVLQSEDQCAEDGVNYCGPGTNQTNPALDIVNVPSCLNEACCQHDSCYGKNCVGDDCHFSPQSQECDDSLWACCQGNGSCNSQDRENKMFQFVCAIVNWMNGTAGSLSAIERNQRVEAYPDCANPASLETCGVACANQTCDTFTSCNPGSGCQNPVCAAIIEGGGACIEGAIFCADLADCTSSNKCYEGLCFVDTCCDRPVCISVQAFCPDIGIQSSSMNSSVNKSEKLQSSNLVGSRVAR